MGRLGRITEASESVEHGHGSYPYGGEEDEDNAGAISGGLEPILLREESRTSLRPDQDPYGNGRYLHHDYGRARDPLLQSGGLYALGAGGAHDILNHAGAGAGAAGMMIACLNSKAKLQSSRSTASLGTEHSRYPLSLTSSSGSGSGSGPGSDSDSAGSSGKKIKKSGPLDCLVGPGTPVGNLLQCFC